MFEDIFSENREGEIKVETYKVDGEPRLKLDIKIGDHTESLIIIGEEYLKRIYIAIKCILMEELK